MTTVQTGTARITHPDQLHDAFMAATNAGDVEGLVSLYDPSGVMVEIDGRETRGVQALRTSFEQFTAAFHHIEGSTRKIIVVGGLALTSADWTAQIVLPDGTMITQTGTTAEVSQRQPDGTWRVLIDDPLF